MIVMKRLASFNLDRSVLRDELAALQNLLQPATRELSEQKDILPFFRKNQNLAALIGFTKSHLVKPDVLKTEFSFLGDHTCDLAIGENARGQFCFVEFEDAKESSIFKRTAKATPLWSSRLEHGFSQIVDWFHTLADQSGTNFFREQFGSDLADYCGLLVIGRDAFLTESEKSRLRWRSQNTLVGGKPVTVITFDQLLQSLTDRVEFCATKPDVATDPNARSTKRTTHKRK